MKLKSSILYLFILGLFLSSCQLPFAQSIYVKRDRYGESPVQDMRTGKSYMEWRYDEDTRKSVQAHLDREEAERQRLIEEQENEKQRLAKGNEPAVEEKSWFSKLFE